MTDSHRNCFRFDCCRSHHRLRRTTVSGRQGRHPHRSNQRLAANSPLGQNNHHRRCQHNRVDRRSSLPTCWGKHPGDRCLDCRQPNHRRCQRAVNDQAGKHRVGWHCSNERLAIQPGGIRPNPHFRSCHRNRRHRYRSIATHRWGRHRRTG